MSILITRENAKRYERELDMAFEFRHEFFVEGLGWEALRSPDGKEMDEFDTEDTAHLLEMVDGKILFYSRFLPTERPHLLSHVFPGLLQGETAPVGPNIWEQSRGTLVRRRLENGMPNPVQGSITLSSIEAAMFVGADYLLVEVHPLFTTRFLEHGMRPEPLAPPLEVNGQQLVAMLLTIDAHTLETTRRFYDRWSPVLYINDIPALDLIQRRAA